MADLHNEPIKCALCGGNIHGKHSTDHFFPRAIYKWAEEYLPKKEYNRLKNRICSKANLFPSHFRCNYAKNESLQNIANLHTSQNKKNQLISLQTKIHPYIQDYCKNKKMLLKQQKNKCYGCGCELCNNGVLRRIDPEMPRTWENGCVVCSECNEKEASFCEKTTD